MTTRPDLEQAARTRVAARTPFVLATVVRAAKPTSARPGDRAIIYPDGRIDGFVGGACASASVRLHALRALAVGQPHLLRIAPDGTAVAADDATSTVTNPCLSGGTLEIFLEPRAPAPVVRVLGDSPIADALAALAAPLGYHVETRGDAQPDDAAVVIASLGHGDDAAVAAALASGAGYVGLVASRRRGAAVVEALRAGGVSDDALSRLRTPAGVAIGARTHAEIALSILAQIVEARASAPPVAVTIPDGLVDPVCGMVEPTGGGFEHVVNDGVEVVFCCSGCRQRFQADPARYLV